MLQNLFYLTTALHVSGVTITHLQEHKTTVTTASCIRYTVTDMNEVAMTRVGSQRHSRKKNFCINILIN
jgi:hypothetical protein